MKKTIFPILWLSLFFLPSCHKSNDGTGSSSDSTITGGSLKLNLNSSEPNWPSLLQANVELIVSEPGGKVLLDTITPVNTHIEISLATRAPTVDLTNICYENYLHQFIVRTFKGVNPSGWAADYNLNDEAPAGTSPTLVPDTLQFINLPTIGLSIFDQSVFNSGFAIPAPPNSISAKYSLVAGNYAYLILPRVNLYKMVIPSGSNQTIDCSTMDTAEVANFSPSSYFTYSNTNVYGYPDTNNLNTELWLYNNDINAETGLPQLEYPAKNIQAYTVAAEFNHNQESVEIYTRGTTINPNITYPDPSSYLISATQNNQFSVSWNAIKPTFYETYWKDSAVSYYLYASADSTTINPVGLLSTQKSKLLQGQDLTQLMLSFFQYGIVSGYGYADYLGLVCDSTLLWKHPVSNRMSYYKFY
jgi:hypothetical protein